MWQNLSLLTLHTGNSVHWWLLCIGVSNSEERLMDFISTMLFFVGQGYLERQAYIATQLPLPHTVVDLWRLMYDNECSCIVMLEQLDIGDEVCRAPFRYKNRLFQV